MALILLGIIGYAGSGGASPTALIPAVFGLVLLILGLMARDDKKRKTAMHIAVIVGLFAFLGTLPGVWKLGQWVAGIPVARPAAVIAQSIMAVLMGIFVAMCVRSFIAARRQRLGNG